MEFKWEHGVLGGIQGQRLWQSNPWLLECWILGYGMSHLGEEPGLAYKVARHWIDIIGLTSMPNFRTLALEPVSLKGTGLCFKLELPAVSSGRPGWLFLYPPGLLSVRSDFPLCTRGLCVCAFRSGNWSWLLLVTSECPDLPDLNLNVILLLNLC